MEIGGCSPWPSVIRPVVVPYSLFCFWNSTRHSFTAPVVSPFGWMDTISSVTSTNYTPRSGCGQSAFSTVAQPEHSSSQDKNAAHSHQDSGFFDDFIGSANPDYASPDKLPDFSFLLQRKAVNEGQKTRHAEEAGRVSFSTPFGISSPSHFPFAGSKSTSCGTISPLTVSVIREQPLKKMGRPPKQSTAVTSHKLRPILSKATSTTSSAMSDASWSCSPEPASPSDNHFIPSFGCTSAGESSHEFPSQLDTVKEEVVVTTECIIPFKPLTSEFSRVYSSFVPPKPITPPHVNLFSSSFQLPMPEKSTVRVDEGEKVSPLRKRLAKKRGLVASSVKGLDGEPKSVEGKRRSGEAKRENTERKTYRMSACDTCGREFRYPRSLLTHQLVHQDIRPHKCPFPSCDKYFRQTGHLQTHLLIHTGDKPFKCPVEGCPTQPFRHANRRCPLHNAYRLVKLNGNGETKPLDLSSHPMVPETSLSAVPSKRNIPPHSAPRGFLENGKQRQEDVAMAMALIQFANGPIPPSQSAS